MSKKSINHIHVIPRNNSWIVRREGDDRLISTHDTKQEAEKAAREIARDAKGELVIHNRDGRISSRDNYSLDPLPPKEPREVLFPVVPSRTSEQTIKKAIRKVMQESQDKTSNAT
ncbi:MAG TPA: DUF2188 domain-containing protein [Anaerolineales bacterium]|nr:DUF2188 domain-containing protein [Anaerolineales bacterium]HLO28556.1 DUF2188 domain-containing protein [Anaerolineales bacterium]